MREVNVDEDQIQVVQGIHPKYVLKEGSSLESLLARRFVQVFEPYAEWLSRRMIMSQELQNGRAKLLRLVELVQQQIQLYGQLCKQAKDIGLEDLVGMSVRILSLLLGSYHCTKKAQWKIVRSSSSDTI
ncbi:hypothetical protein BDW69DRAFT_172408 [Aspergillus filifer]